MKFKAGNGAIDLDAEHGTFSIWIDHEGTGDEGGTERLEWVSGVTPDELRALGEAFIQAAAAKDT